MRYLFQRQDFFYFFRRIPQELQAQLGYRREIRLSLGTTDRRAAKKIVKQYDLEMDKLWMASRMKLPEDLLMNFIRESPLFRAKEAVEDLRFTSCTSQFLTEKKATIRPDGIETYQAVFHEFTDICKDRNVKAYTHADMIRFREVISSKGIKPTTVNKKLRYLSVFFNWLVTHGIIRATPCKGLTIPKQQPDHELKKVFSDEDIDRWFSSPAFMPETCRNYQPQEFWIPLIGLLGLRVNEICQLRTVDVKEVDGIWCLDINANDGKWVKNLGSVRLVPITQSLLDIGLLDYCQRRKDAGETQLFPIRFLKANRPDYNYHVRHYFRRFVTKDAKKTFNSFRHGLATALKARGDVPEAIISQIMGHTNPSMTFGRYGKPYPPAILLEALNKVDYRLDVKRLREVGATFR